MFHGNEPGAKQHTLGSIVGPICDQSAVHKLLPNHPFGAINGIFFTSEACREDDSPPEGFYFLLLLLFFYITNSCLRWVKGREMLLQVWWTRESGDGDDFCLFVVVLRFFFFLNVNFTPPSFAGVVQRSWQSAVCHVLLNLAKMRSVFGHPSRSNTTKSCCA